MKIDIFKELDEVYFVNVSDLCIGDKFSFNENEVIYTYIGNHHYAGRTYVLYETGLVTHVERWEDISKKKLIRR